jgi:hypothetical protein
MDVLNLNGYAVHPRIRNAEGVVDSVHIMPKRRVTLPKGFSVDSNWLASTPKVSIYESSDAKVAMTFDTLRQAQSVQGVERPEFVSTVDATVAAAADETTKVSN